MAPLQSFHVKNKSIVPQTIGDDFENMVITRIKHPKQSMKHDYVAMGFCTKCEQGPPIILRGRGDKRRTALTTRLCARARYFAFDVETRLSFE